MTERSRVRPELGWTVVVGVEALLIVLLLPFGFVFTGTPFLHQFQLVVLGAAGAAGWVLVVWRRSSLAPLVVLAPMPLLAAVVVTALVSPYPSLSWPAAWQTAAYTGIFWLLARQASHPVGRRNLLAVITIVVILALASFLLTVLINWVEWLSFGFPLTSLPLRPSNGGGLALVPTWLADLVALGTPMIVASLWTRGLRIPAVALSAVALMAIVVTGTRSVLLIIVGVSFVAALIAFRNRTGRRAVSAVIFGVITVGILGAAVALGSSRSLDEGRSSAYASAVARMSESPLVGAGPGTYGVERMRDPVDVIGHLAFPDAHNIILNTMAESGVVGLAGLLATLALYAAAIRRSWRRSLGDRLVIAGALFGLAVFAAHGMVDVIFGLVGIIVIAVAVAAIAATSSEKAEAASHPAPWPMRAGLAFAFMIVILISGAVIRTETIAGTVAVADAALGSAPAEALVLARLATASAPDLVPAWWVQMAAADAVGDTEAAVEAARTLIKLEGFGQQWMSLAILASRQGDRTAADTAIKTASGRLPIDPLVELNGIAMLDALSDRPVTEEMGYRLLQVQPDIEPIVRDGSARMEATLAAVRARAARQLLAEGDDQSAFLVALSGEDHALSQVLLDEVATNGSTQGETWSQIVRGWFGDSTGREALDRLSRLDPKLDNLLWSWRFAGRACDEQAMAFWERAVEIGYAFHPTTPNSLTIAPPTSRANLPLLYPTFIWRQDHPVQPYVAGTWIFDSGRPVCVRSGG